MGHSHHRLALMLIQMTLSQDFSQGFDVCAHQVNSIMGLFSPAGTRVSGEDVGS